MEHQFLHKGKFAILTFNNVYVDVPSPAFRLSDGTWAMHRVPVPDLSIWKEWIGSIRIEQLEKANLVLLVEEPSANPEILDAVHKRLGEQLSLLFSVLHLRSGIECESADLLCGSAQQGVPEIRQLGQLPTFLQSKGYRRAPVTKDWLEEGAGLSASVKAMEANKPEFERVIRGLVTLLKGLKETGQDRLHQCVRSLEALILPAIGKTEKLFAHRCQTFGRPGDDTRALLLEAFAMRSDTEHLHSWERAVQGYSGSQWEDVCWHRTRQMERLACHAYSRLLRTFSLWDHFRTDDTIDAFWKMPDDQRRALWGGPLDIAQEPFVQKYDQWGRAIA